MGELADTQPSLLMRIRNRQDKESWSRFVGLYAPVVYGFLRKRGLQDADAADLTQDILIAVAKAIGDFAYDSERGSFRRWLLTVVRNRLHNHWTRGQRAPRAQGGTEAQDLLLAQPEPEAGDSADWDEAYERQLFQSATEQVRGDFHESTWLAFWRTAVEGRPAKAVADSLGMSLAATYMAKHRVLARLKEQIVFLQGE